MLFNESLAIDIIEGMEIITREAVRAIILKDGKLLMIKSEKGDHKLPGGGINVGESHEEALSREITEETGYLCKQVSPLIGKVFERKIDFFEPDKIFEMTSYYYLAEVHEGEGDQELDHYEAELGFEPLWIAANAAIKENEKFIAKPDSKVIWTARENHILNLIQNFEEDELRVLK